MISSLYKGSLVFNLLQRCFKVLTMKKLLLLGAVFLMVLFAGCVGGEQPPAETGGTTEMGDGVEETGDGTTGDGMEDGTDTGDGTGETEDETPEDTGDVDLEGLAYMELIALGVPVQCELTTTYEGETTTATMYMQGENKVRYESTSYYDGKTLVVIMRDGITYMTNFMSDEVPECEWLMMEPEEAEPGEPGDYTYTSSVPDFEEMPDTSFECSPWMYDESKFQVPTQNVCTMDEFMDMMMAGYDIPQ